MTKETAAMAIASGNNPRHWPQHAVWIGLTLAAGNFILYARIIPISPELRDNPWINIPLSWLGLALAVTGAWFVFKQGGVVWRKGLAASALVLTFFLVGLFNWYVFSFSYSLPESADATATQAAALDFSLRDHNNRDVKLSDYRGNKVVLIFYRGHWCPFCLSELQGLQSHLEEIRETDARVLAVCVDSVEKNAKVVENLDLDFSILSDPDLKVIKAFGLLHEGGYFREGVDVARPAIFVLDQQGVVRWRYLTDNWRVRVRPATILEQLSKIQ